MAVYPAVREVQTRTVPRVMERSDDPMSVASIPVRADERSPFHLAGQAVDAGVVGVDARAVSPPPGTVVGRAGHVRQHAKVIVERAVLLHHDDDVRDVLQVAIGTDRRGTDDERTDDHRRSEGRTPDPRAFGHDLPSFPDRAGDPASQRLSTPGRLIRQAFFWSRYGRSLTSRPCRPCCAQVLSTSGARLP